MPNALIINAYHPHPGTDGKLTTSLEKESCLILKDKGYTIARTHPPDGWNVEDEINKHIYADLILLLAPVYWMGVSWSFQKYMDEVYSDGMDGQMSNGDGRTRKDPSKLYGTGGRLMGKYIIATTFNAPETAFNDPTQPLFKGRSVDDLFFPMHANFQFFGLKPLPSFAMFDVYKNPDIKNDLAKFNLHLDTHA